MMVMMMRVGREKVLLSDWQLPHFVESMPTACMLPWKITNKHPRFVLLSSRGTRKPKGNGGGGGSAELTSKGWKSWNTLNFRAATNLPPFPLSSSLPTRYGNTLQRRAVPQEKTATDHTVSHNFDFGLCFLGIFCQDARRRQLN